MARTESRRPPRFRDLSYTCPHCAVLAGQSWESLLIGFPTAWGPPGTDYARDLSDLADGDDETSSPTFSMSTCQACRGVALWRGEVMVYPSAIVAHLPHPDMPAAARSFFVEASQVVAPSRRAAAALARAALESLLREHFEEPKATLDDLIAKVQPQVNSSLGRLLTVVRHVGNKSLHGPRADDRSIMLYLDDEDPTVVDAIFVAVNDLVDELITKPRETNAVYEAVPPEVREAAERKAKA